MCVTTSLFLLSPQHFSDIFHLLSSEPWILQSLNRIPGGKEGYRKTKHTHKKIRLVCSQQWGATESQVKLPLAELLSISLNLKLSFKVSQAIHAKESHWEIKLKKSWKNTSHRKYALLALSGLYRSQISIYRGRTFCVCVCVFLIPLPSYIVIRLQTIAFFCCWKSGIKEAKISIQLCDHWLALYPKVVKKKKRYNIQKASHITHSKR